MAKEPNNSQTTQNTATESADANGMDVNLVSKITLAGMKCKPTEAKSQDKPVLVARIYGNASGIKIKKDPAGNPFEAITGDFEGVNMQTGEVFGSGVLYLPAGLHEMIIEPLKRTADEDGKVTGSIEFGLDISAVPAKNPIGYSYQAKPLVKPSAADPLAKLRAALPPLPKLLAAPKS